MSKRALTISVVGCMGKICTAIFMIWVAIIGMKQNARAFDWTPSDQELKRYRSSWNPATHGPSLIVSADTTPKDQFLFYFFVFGQLGNGQFESNLKTRKTASPWHSDAISPSLYLTYGLTEHVSLDLGLSWIYWTTNQLPGAFEDESGSAGGIGDTSLIFQYRPVLQNPESWQPSIGTYTKFSLPTSQWAGTEEPPGGFTPFSRVPDTRFGSFAITQGLLLRKNIKPIRLSGAVFYTYNAPGEEDGGTVYPGDLVNVRVGIEHILSDEHGFGYAVEFVSAHQLPFRLDGHSLNEIPQTFSIFGVQPTLEFKLLEDPIGKPRLVAAIGNLFTVAGQNDLDAFYPNISFKYFWDPF